MKKQELHKDFESQAQDSDTDSIPTTLSLSQTGSNGSSTQSSLSCDDTDDSDSESQTSYDSSLSAPRSQTDDPSQLVATPPPVVIASQLSGLSATMRQTGIFRRMSTGAIDTAATQAALSQIPTTPIAGKRTGTDAALGSGGDVKRTQAPQPKSPRA